MSDDGEEHLEDVVEEEAEEGAGAEEEEEEEGEDLAAAAAAHPDSSEEEDDELQNEYEEDGFVVNEEEEEEEDEDDEELAKKKKKKKSKRKKELSLDDEDYDLLEEGGVKVPAVGLSLPTPPLLAKHSLPCSTSLHLCPVPVPGEAPHREKAAEASHGRQAGHRCTGDEA